MGYYLCLALQNLTLRYVWVWGCEGRAGTVGLRLRVLAGSAEAASVRLKATRMGARRALELLVVEVGLLGKLGMLGMRKLGMRDCLGLVRRACACTSRRATTRYASIGRRND
jgi:hypothetical protein